MKNQTIQIWEERGFLGRHRKCKNPEAEHDEQVRRTVAGETHNNK